MASSNTRRFNSTPSPRILELARPRESKTVWLTTPVNVTWGNQETIWPPFWTSLKARNMSRILALSQPKKDFSALHQDLLRKDHKEAAKMRSTCLPATSQYEQVSRLATPNFRHRCPQVLSLPHTKQCEHSCPVWHISSAVKNAVASPRILQLAQPRHTHPEYQSNRQNIETCVSCAANSSQVSLRLEQLCVPKLRESKLFYQYGCPESPIRPVSKAARKATASARVKELSIPKSYTPP
ncbi:testicular haploid expressed gene protein-like isoform X1 [Tachysurus ichikawai]